MQKGSERKLGTERTGEGGGHLSRDVLPEAVEEVLPELRGLAPLLPQPDQEDPHVQALEVEARREVLLQP